ncbi:MAG: MFS transporter [Chloroflexi bacterium]|nr:MFS transporter [Chloroflexota bacterium]
MLNRIGRIVSPYRLLLPLCFGVFIAADDMTVVVTLLPDMLVDLRVGVSELDRASWAITGFLIGFTAAMPLMGRISDRSGYRLAFLAALAVFTLGSALVALSPQIPGWLYGGLPDFNWLVGMRVFQAIGGGALIPISIAAVRELVDGRHRAIAYGLVGASAEAGGVFGPLWGGGITTLLSWEWAFWLNIPVTIIAAVWFMRNPPGKKNPHVKVNVPAGLVFAAALALLIVGLVRIGDPDALMAISLAVTAGLVILLVVMNTRSLDALFPRPLFRLPSFNFANITHFLVGAVLIIGMVTVPLMAATVFGKTPIEGGLQLLRMTIAIGVAAVIGGIITQRIGPRVPALVGLIVTSLGFLLLSGWTVDIAEPALTVHLVITGLGIGLLVSPIAETALFRVLDDQRGAASALITVSRMVGMTAGLAAMTALGTVQFQQLVADVPAFSPDPADQVRNLETITNAGVDVFTRFYQYAAGLSALALVPAWLMTRRVRPVPSPY